MAEDANRNPHPPSRAAPGSVQFTGRQVIEHKLLTALEDGQSVAILATRRDLEDMLDALQTYEGPEDRLDRCLNLAAGLRQLLTEAFPPNAQAEPRPGEQPRP